MSIACGHVETVGKCHENNLSGVAGESLACVREEPGGDTAS